MNTGPTQHRKFGKITERKLAGIEWNRTRSSRVDKVNYAKAREILFHSLTFSLLPSGLRLHVDGPTEDKTLTVNPTGLI
jgi:hypothetical protein